MLRNITVLMLLLLAATVVESAGLEVQLANKAAQFNYLSNSSVIGYGGADLKIGFFYNEKKDYVLNAGVKTTGSPGENQPITFGVGAQIYLINTESDMAAQAIAIGAEGKYHLPGRMPIAAVLEFHYAPSITTFGDGELVSDFNVRFEIEIIPSTVGFIGNRWFNVDLNNGIDPTDSYELDQSIHIGFRMAL